MTTTVANELLQAHEKIARLEREIHFLRLYGNKDCTHMADERIDEDRKMQVGKDFSFAEDFSWYEGHVDEDIIRTFVRLQHEGKL